MNTIIFLFFLLLYYFIYVYFGEHPQMLLTISTFLFAIFTGFFISRQGARYSAIRDQINIFDGEMSALYRKFGHLSKEAQKHASIIIKKYYQKILKNKAWDYNFINKSSTLTEMHALLEKTTKNKMLDSLKTGTTTRILDSLGKMQVARKKIIALHNERIPKFQWILIYSLAAILLASVSGIPSQYALFSSILKAIFSSTIIFVIILLSEFDRLRFFEGIMGEKSAQDVLDILVNKK